MQFTNTQVADALKAQFGSAIQHTYEPYGMLTVFVEKTALYNVAQFLKNDPTFNFHFLTTMCGLHYPDRVGQEMGLMMQLHNWQANARVRLETFFATDDVTFPTFTTLWESANWMEREAWDFFGLKFEGHPNLIRILNEEDMDYHPLLKQYPLEDGTRTDKDDRFFGRAEGNKEIVFERRVDRQYKQIEK